MQHCLLFSRSDTIFYPELRKRFPQFRSERWAFDMYVFNEDTFESRNKMFRSLPFYILKALCTLRSV